MLAAIEIRNDERSDGLAVFVEHWPGDDDALAEAFDMTEVVASVFRAELAALRLIDAMDGEMRHGRAWLDAGDDMGKTVGESERGWLKRAVRLVGGLLLIALVSLAGEMIIWGSGVPLPPAIVGLLLLAATVTLSERAAAIVKPAARLLLALLGALIVPPFVGLALFSDELRTYAAGIAVLLLVTTIATGLVAAWTYRLLAGRS